MLIKGAQVVTAETCSRSPVTVRSPSRGAGPGHTVFSVGFWSRWGFPNVSDSEKSPGRPQGAGPTGFSNCLLSFHKGTEAFELWAWNPLI